MSIVTNIVTAPNNLSPMNNLYGNYFELSNTSFTLTNFRYITRLYATNPTISPLYTFLVQETQPARPNTGNGIYSGYQSLLTKLSYDINITTNSPTFSSHGIVAYYINYGFGYNPNYPITGFGGLGGDTVVFVGGTYDIQIGDVINIQTQNPPLNGPSTVVGIWGGDGVSPIVNAPLGGSPVMTGNIIDLQRCNATSSTYYGFNGARQYNNGVSTSTNYNYFNSYVMGQTTSATIPVPFVTDFPYSMTGSGNSGVIQKPMLLGNYETLSCFINEAVVKSVGATPQVFYTMYDITGTNIYTTASSFKPLIPTGVTGVMRMDIPVGTAQQPMSSVLKQFPSTYKYLVGIYDGISGWSLGGTTGNMVYNLDYSYHLYNNVRVFWMNSFGAWDYFDFQKDDQKSRTITRNEYKQILPVIYNSGARERTILNNVITEQHLINTDWVSEDLYAYLGQILISTEVYVQPSTKIEGVIVNTTIVNGGTGWSPMDTFYIPTGPGTASLFEVLTVVGGGIEGPVATYQIVNRGHGYGCGGYTVSTALPPLELSSGTGLVLNILSTGEQQNPGSILPVIVTDPQFTYATANRDQIFQLALTYEYSYAINSQHQ